jgi:signal transduction histidine kinase
MNPSIRALSVGVLTFIGLLSMGSLGALVWTSSLLSRETETVTRDTWSAALASELELDLLMYSRLSRLHGERRDPQLHDLRVALARDIHTRIDEAHKHSTGVAEDAIVDEVSILVTHYLTERARLEESGLPVDVVVAETRASLDAAVTKIEEWRALNDAEVANAKSAVADVDAISNAAGVLAAVLLAAGLVFVAFGVRRRIVLPLLGLHRTITAFRRGDFEVRAAERGPRELVNVARAFNEMRDALDAQRKDQLAFLAGVAHDLRNPISALKMSVSFLGEDATDEERAQTLPIVERQLARLGQMVDDLLDANRIEAGELELALADVDVRDVARDVVDLYAPTSSSHELVVDPPSEPLWIRADPLRLEQAVGNLVSNAIKYSPEGGRIELALRTAGSDAVLSVADQGIGIAPEDIERIFAPFHRSARGVAPGAGLGLSIVRRIVEAHGGRIEVESTPGKGSRFVVRLPLLSATDVKRARQRAGDGRDRREESRPARAR